MPRSRNPLEVVSYRMGEQLNFESMLWRPVYPPTCFRVFDEARSWSKVSQQECQALRSASEACPLLTDLVA